MTESSTATALAELVLAEDKVHQSLVPDDVVIRDYLSCINDDTWVRHAELVKLSDLKETPHEEAVKEEVLRTYIEERRRSQDAMPRDLIMEGILWQERFMEEYKREHRAQDKTEALNYKKNLIESFRTKKTGPRLTGGAAGERKALEYKTSQDNAAAYRANNYPTQETYDQAPSMYTPAVQREEANHQPTANTAEYPREEEEEEKEKVEVPESKEEDVAAPIKSDYPEEENVQVTEQPVQEDVAAPIKSDYPEEENVQVTEQPVQEDVAAPIKGDYPSESDTNNVKHGVAAEVSDETTATHGATEVTNEY